MRWQTAGGQASPLGEAIENTVEKLRAVKDAGELARIREAAELISEVFARSCRRSRPGVTELELAAEIEYRMKRRGASGPSFETIVASGPAVGLGARAAHVQAVAEK